MHADLLTYLLLSAGLALAECMEREKHLLLNFHLKLQDGIFLMIQGINFYKDDNSLIIVEEFPFPHQLLLRTRVSASCSSKLTCQPFNRDRTTNILNRFSTFNCSSKCHSNCLNLVIIVHAYLFILLYFNSLILQLSYVVFFIYVNSALLSQSLPGRCCNCFGRVSPSASVLINRLLITITANN